MTDTGLILFLSSCATAIIHALIPDHWLPFVLLGRSQRWTDRRLVALVGMAGVLHVVISIAVAGAAILAGTSSARGLAMRTGHSLEYLAGLFLVVFGLGYGLLAHLREARAHTGGPAPAGHLHAHGHLLGRWFREALTGGALVAIVGISPCALLVPVLFAAAAQGVATMAVAAAGFTICTLATMIGVALLATRGMRQIDLPLFARYGDLASGLIIAAMGVWVMCLER